MDVMSHKDALLRKRGEILAAGGAATRRDHVQVELTVRIGAERDRLPVGRPGRIALAHPSAVRRDDLLFASALGRHRPQLVEPGHREPPAIGRKGGLTDAGASWGLRGERRRGGETRDGDGSERAIRAKHARIVSLLGPRSRRCLPPPAAPAWRRGLERFQDRDEEKQDKRGAKDADRGIPRAEAAERPLACGHPALDGERSRGRGDAGRGPWR